MKKNNFNMKLLNYLVCPKTKNILSYNKKTDELVSKKARLAYPIKNGVPILVVKKARKL